MSGSTPDAILAKTAKGAGWIIGWRLTTRLIGLLSTLFLVRLLTPADFGLVALATGFGAAADSLSWLGVEEAVIREPTPSRALYDSAFTVNLIRGTATAAVLAAAAWPTAVFFDDARLWPVMLALAGGWIIVAFENIGIVDFRRDIAFEREFVLMSVPRVISMVTGIALAYAWHSYWALIAALLVSMTLRVVLSYVMHPFRPRLGLGAWRQIAGFSFWSWMLGLAGLLRDRGDTFIIGRALGVGPVGVFSVGAEIASLPVTEFVSPLGRACFSSFSAARIAGAEADLAQAFLRVLGSTTLVALPACVGISLMAGPIVGLAFGPEWHAAVPVIQVLGCALAATALGMIATALLNAYAVLQRMFWIQLAALAVRIPVIVLLVWQVGLTGAAIGAGIASALEHLLTVGIALHRMRLTWASLLGVTWRGLAASLTMAFVLAYAGIGWARAPLDAAGSLATLITGVAAGVAIFGLALAALWLAMGRPDGAETDLLRIAGRGAERAWSIVKRQARFLQRT